MSSPVKTPEMDKDLNNKASPPSDEPSAIALLTLDENQSILDPESTPESDSVLTYGKPESPLSGANSNPNLDLNPNSDLTPDLILDQNSDHTIGAQALSPSTSLGNMAPTCKVN